MSDPGTHALDAILNNHPERAEDMLRKMSVPELDKLIDALDDLGGLADGIALQKTEPGEP